MYLFVPITDGSYFHDHKQQALEDHYDDGCVDQENSMGFNPSLCPIDQSDSHFFYGYVPKKRWDPPSASCDLTFQTLKSPKEK